MNEAHGPKQRLINIVGIVNDEWNDAGWSAAGERTEILRHFARFTWHDKARAIVALPEQWRKWALYERRNPFQGSEGPVTLIGDAAHPMLPFLAQGAGMAIEDATVLAACLASDIEHPVTALRAYPRLEHGDLLLHAFGDEALHLGELLEARLEVRRELVHARQLLATRQLDVDQDVAVVLPAETPHDAAGDVLVEEVE